MSSLKTDFEFPLLDSVFRGLPINMHPGSFGYDRFHYNHTGIDLYGTEGDEVYAIRYGVVVRNFHFTGAKANSKYWLPTDAVLVKDDAGYYVYGELKSDLTPGEILFPGDLIGTLLPVVKDVRPEYPGHSTTMLHLERHDLTYNPEDGWLDWFKASTRPKCLVDPTPGLVEILAAKKKPIQFLTV